MATHHMRMQAPGSKLALGVALQPSDMLFSRPKRGVFIFDMRDAKTGEQIVWFEKENAIVKDAGIVSASLHAGFRVGGITMLGVGTGATGALLSPDAPQVGQRKLNAEIERKPFSSVQNRDSQGTAVSIETNIVDFTTVFAESEAVGPLNEMGLMLTASENPTVLNPVDNGPSDYDPTIDVDGKDLLINYSTFSVVSKPATATLTITWRLTF